MICALRVCEIAELRTRNMKSCVVAICLFVAWLPPLVRAEEPSSPATSALSLESYRVVSSPDPPIMEPEEPYALQEPPVFEQQRPGILQGLYQSTTVLAAEVDQLSITELDFSATFGFPMPTRESPLLITLICGLDVLGVDSLDLPDDFYDAAVEVRHLRPIGDCLTLDVAATPGVYGNTDTSESDLRIQGRAIGIYQWRPDTKAILGIVYLDREDIALLPVAGLVWTPRDYLRLDLLFPKPRIALRSYYDCYSVWWLYVGGELGGGSWGVTRAGGAGDIATLRDYRLLVGMERQAELVTLRLEGGYAFSRELEYASGVGDVSLDNVGFVRAVVSY
jgi:hypothetical protein